MSKFANLWLVFSGKHPILQFAAGSFEFLGDQLFVGKDGLIFSGELLVGKMVGRSEPLTDDPELEVISPAGIRLQ